MQMTFSMPIRTRSEANMREHWAVKAKRAKMQRQIACLFTGPAFPWAIMPTSKAVITLTRVANRMLDSDNLAGSFKAIRDGIADGMDVDDGADNLEWVYKQRKGKPKEYAIEVVIDIDTTQ